MLKFFLYVIRIENECIYISTEKITKHINIDFRRIKILLGTRAPQLDHPGKRAPPRLNNGRASHGDRLRFYDLPLSQDIPQHIRSNQGKSQNSSNVSNSQKLLT